jgi:rhamnogalacturonan endolyase
MKTSTPFRALTLLLIALALLPALAQRPLEYLTRGLVAVHQGEGKVFVSWRLLGTDPDDVAFNLYRSTSFGVNPTLLNKEPIRGGTNFVDTGVRLDDNTTYSVRPVLKGAEIAERARDFTLPAHAPARPYLEVPLKTPKGYAPNDCSEGGFSDKPPSPVTQTKAAYFPCPPTPAVLPLHVAPFFDN